MANTKLKDFNTYKQILAEGGFIIAAGSGPAPFVQPNVGAHFVTIVGTTDDGKFLVADPYPKTADKNVVAWDAQQMMRSIFGAVVLYEKDTIKTSGSINGASSPSDVTESGIVDHSQELAPLEDKLATLNIVTPERNDSTAVEWADKAHEGVQSRQTLKADSFAEEFQNSIEIEMNVAKEAARVDEALRAISESMNQDELLKKATNAAK